MAIDIEYKGLSSGGIPVPPKPPQDPDPDPKSYIPSGMSPDDRLRLRAAAREMSDSLGGGYYSNMMAQVTEHAESANNMYHYRTGGGKDKIYDEDDVYNIRRQVNAVGAFENSNLQLFFEKIVDDFGPRNDLTGGYLSFNTNRGINWFGQYAITGKWYYALGGFQIAYGAQAVRKIASIDIKYRLFVADRYNWDDGKQVDIPRHKAEFNVNDPVMNNALGLRDNRNREYFSRTPHSYVISDSLMGSLQAFGDAKPYDIGGAGKIRLVTFPL